MKKILFVSVNSRYSHSCPALYYLRSIAEDYPFQTKILETSIQDSTDERLRLIYEEKPDFLVLSVYIWNRSQIQALGVNVKKILPDIRIICGGPELSWDSEDIIHEFDFADYIIQGAGEKAFQLLLEKQFVYDQRFLKIQNSHFNHIPFPYKEADLPTLQNHYIYYESSRGCPFKCSYCLSSREDQVLEYKDVEKVKQELVFFIQNQVTIVKFVDRSFNVNQTFARNIWRFLIDQKPKTKFHFEIHPLYLEEEDFTLLQNAPKDLFQFEIGVQSIHQETLNAINRQVKWADIRGKIIRILSLSNIHSHLDQIAGLPFETYSMIRESFNEILRLSPDHFQPGLLKILKGAPIHTKVSEFSLTYSSEAPYPLLFNQWISYSEINEYLSVETVVDIVYNSGHFKNLMKCLLVKNQDPYSFFLGIARLFKQKNINKFIKDKYLIIESISIVISQNDPENETLYREALILDWAINSQTHQYPPFLLAELSDKLKEDYWELIKSSGIKGLYHIGENSFSLNELRKSSFFHCSHAELIRILNLKSNRLLVLNKDTLIPLDDLNT